MKGGRQGGKEKEEGGRKRKEERTKKKRWRKGGRERERKEGIAVVYHEMIVAQTRAVIVKVGNSHGLVIWSWLKVISKLKNSLICERQDGRRKKRESEMI